VRPAGEKPTEMIRFVCEHCRRPVRVDDACGGRRGRCPHCQRIVSIPPRGDAIEALAAVLSPDGGEGSEGSSLGAVPPPPPVRPGGGEEEIVLPEDDEQALEDTVILPAEGVSLPVEPPAGTRYRRPARRPPAISTRRTLLLVVAVVVVLAAAAAALVILSQM